MTGNIDSIPDPILEQATQWLLRLQDAPADAALQDDLAAWIAADETHARAWHLANKAWRLTGDTRPVFAADWKATATRESPAPDSGASRHSMRRRRLRRGAIVAALAASLAFAAVIPALQLRLTADHWTAVSEAREVTLQDGSHIHLGGASALAADFTPQARHVTLLRGEAFFQVKTDTARPFVVHAADLTVTVTGTAFDVGFTDRTVSVAVSHGAVRVTQPGKSGIDGWREVSLSAGHRFVLDRAAGKAVTSDIAPSAVAAWRDGRLVVENALLDDVVTAIGRYHSGAILVTDRSLRESRVTGVYDLRDPVRALRVLSAPYGGVVRELTPYVLVLSAG